MRGAAFQQLASEEEVLGGWNRTLTTASCATVDPLKRQCKY